MIEFDFGKQPGINRKTTLAIPEKILMSIITPFYNAGEFFEQTFNCVINQTFIWFEWIIVDDGSTSEDDVKMLEELSKLDDRIKVYHIKNSGPAAARNWAVLQTSTNLIVSLDADDLIEPVYLEQTYFALYFNPTASWAYTDSLGFGNLEYVWKVSFDSERLKKKNFLIEVGTFRKDIFEAVGGYDAAQKHSHEDWNLWLRFLEKGGYPVHISSLSAWYRIVDNGALHKTNDNPKVRRRAYRRNQEVAKRIVKPVVAIEYPRIIRPGQYHMPKCSDWSLKKEKRKIEVLLLSDLEDTDDFEFRVGLITALEKRGYHIGIMTTEVVDNAKKQCIAEKIDDLFELPCFLDINNYAEFISYYIKSRQVDIIIISNSLYGYQITPWLRKEFSSLIIVDILKKNQEYKNVMEENSFGRYFVDKTYNIVENISILQMIDEFEDDYKLYKIRKQNDNWKMRYDELVNHDLVIMNELLLYEKIYSDFEKKIERTYRMLDKKKKMWQRFKDTKFGSLVLEIIDIKNRRVLSNGIK